MTTIWTHASVGRSKRLKETSPTTQLGRVKTEEGYASWSRPLTQKKHMTYWTMVRLFTFRLHVHLDPPLHEPAMCSMTTNIQDNSLNYLFFLSGNWKSPLLISHYVLGMWIVWISFWDVVFEEITNKQMCSMMRVLHSMINKSCSSKNMNPFDKYRQMDPQNHQTFIQ